MKRLIVLLSLLVAFLNRLADELERYRAERAARKQADETAKLRQDPAQWWQDNFGTSDVGDDVRLSGATKEVTAAAAPAADDHSS